jgi:hypothetical protein
MSYYKINGQLIKCTDDGHQCVVLSENDVPAKLKTMVAERTGGAHRLVAFAISLLGRSPRQRWIVSNEAADEPQYSEISEGDVPQQVKDAAEKLGKQG